MRNKTITWPSVVLLSLLLVLGGCQGRDIRSLKKALLGHWVTESGKTHYYIGAATIVMLDEGRRMDQTYTVLEFNEAENWTKIRVKTGYGVGHDKKLLFSPDRKSLTEIIEPDTPDEAVISTRWNYVDSNEMPEERSAVQVQPPKDMAAKEEYAKRERLLREQEDAEATRAKQLLGDELVCSVNTAGQEYLNEPVNKSIESLRAFINRESGALTIVFDFNGKALRIYQPLCQRLLVRTFDRNGQYLDHFITKERFVQPDEFRQDLRQKAGLVELKTTGNLLQYQINLRDASFMAAIELGFMSEGR